MKLQVVATWASAGRAWRPLPGGGIKKKGKDQGCCRVKLLPVGEKYLIKLLNRSCFLGLQGPVTLRGQVFKRWCWLADKKHLDLSCWLQSIDVRLWIILHHRLPPSPARPIAALKSLSILMPAAPLTPKPC